jgi:hypothetical protein
MMEVLVEVTAIFMVAKFIDASSVGDLFTDCAKPSAERVLREVVGDPRYPHRDELAGEIAVVTSCSICKYPATDCICNRAAASQAAADKVSRTARLKVVEATKPTTKSVKPKSPPKAAPKKPVPVPVPAKKAAKPKTPVVADDDEDEDEEGDSKPRRPRSGRGEQRSRRAMRSWRGHRCRVRCGATQMHPSSRPLRGAS